MVPNEREQLLPRVRALALEAGAAILRHYETGVPAATKSDGSPVTAADLEADAILLEGLHHLTPGIPVVTEERAEAGHLPDVSGGRFWLVDPLDGTRAFLRRTGEFTVNVALMEDFRPVLGVLFAPVLGELYAAAGPGSAVRARGGGADEPIRVRAVPSEGLTALVSRQHEIGPDVDRILAHYRVAARVPISSALKFGRIAAGEADIYPRVAPTSEWDTAAGDAILRAAGGRVEAPDGSPFAYGKPDFLNGPFVAFGGVA